MVFLVKSYKGLYSNMNISYVSWNFPDFYISLLSFVAPLTLVEKKILHENFISSVILKNELPLPKKTLFLLITVWLHNSSCKTSVSIYLSLFSPSWYFDYPLQIEQCPSVSHQKVSWWQHYFSCQGHIL